MSTIKIAIGVMAGSLALGSVVASLADSSDRTEVRSIQFEDEGARREDLDTELVTEENERGDGDGTRGNDGTGGGNNTGDGDGTDGDDGTGGGDNTYVASAGGASYSGGGGGDASYSGGGSISGGGSTG